MLQWRLKSASWWHQRVPAAPGARQRLHRHNRQFCAWRCCRELEPGRTAPAPDSLHERSSPRSRSGVTCSFLANDDGAIGGETCSNDGAELGASHLLEGSVRRSGIACG
jgi:hypothetical protein